ncbi:hypothetical protein [Paraburkholderia sp. BR14320]|uniref:hypothetical protein n=1 Tax=unclassified Paraburkholderia TaxID=2615204 RepID=UPI0034CEFA4D
MSKNSRQARETFAPEEVTPIDRYEPDYQSRCMNCGGSPTVLGVNANGKVVYAASMCGMCVWGEAEAINPANW